MVNIHIKYAWDYIRRSPFQALAAYFVLNITFFIITSLAIITYSSDQLLKYFETRPQVIAFLKDETTTDSISNLQNKLENDYRIKDVIYVSKEEALDIYKKATSDNPLLSELVSPSIFPASLEVSLNDLNFAQQVIDEIKNESIVDQVSITASLGGENTLGDVINRLRTITRYIRIGGTSFALLLISTSLLVLVIIISMRITTRRGDIEIMKLIGATPSFIRGPIILEALIYALAGVFSGWLTVLIIVLYATPSLISYFGDIPILPKNTLGLLTIFGAILMAELVIGIFLALLGSILAVSRVRRKG